MGGQHRQRLLERIRVTQPPASSALPGRPRSRAGLRSFASEQLLFVAREAPAGLLPFAYLMGRMAWDALLMAAYPAIFLAFL